MQDGTEFSLLLSFFAFHAHERKKSGGIFVRPTLLVFDCFGLCRHSLPYAVCIAIHKAHDAVVVLGVLVAHATALHYPQLSEVKLHRLYSLSLDGG